MSGWENELLPPSHWDDAMVSGWMVTVMPVFSWKYVLSFRNMGIDGKMLLTLTEEDLVGLGIQPKLHLKRFAAEIDILRRRDRKLIAS